MPRPSHPPWLDNSNYTWRTIQVMKLLGYLQLKLLPSYMVFFEINSFNNFKSYFLIIQLNMSLPHTPTQTHTQILLRFFTNRILSFIVSSRRATCHGYVSFLELIPQILLE
jgi:hypothetical protein